MTSSDLATYRLALRTATPEVQDEFLWSVAAHVARAQAGSYVDGIDRAAALLIRWFLDPPTSPRAAPLADLDRRRRDRPSPVRMGRPRAGNVSSPESGQKRARCQPQLTMAATDGGGK